MELPKSHDFEEIPKDNKGEEKTSDPSEERESSPSEYNCPRKTVVRQYAYEELRPSQMEVDKLRERNLGVLNKTTGKCSEQHEASSNFILSELLILKEKNKALKVELKVIKKEMGNKGGDGAH
ncbi:hypothetical protein V6N13_117908 [Hibiscus sabdariffa]